jgi:hypothetical protein
MPGHPVVNWILNSPPVNFWFAVALAVGSAIAAFVYAFLLLYRVRVMEDTPTSRIRSAAQGYVELSGHGELMEGAPIIAPLTTTPCTWYRYKVEKLGDKHSRVVESGTSEELFFLVGETGRAVVDPEGATVICKTKDVWYEGGYPSRKRSHHSRGLLGRLAGGKYRYTEERMHPGEPLYAIGMFMSIGGGAEAFNTDAEVRELLKTWKQNPKDLLQRFDANGDGEIDLQEWEAARKAAHAHVRREQVQRGVQDATHVMTKPHHGNRPFLLSVIPQHELIRRYRLWGVVSLAGFFVLGGAVVWALTLRFSI